MTVTELRDQLNALIAAGRGDAPVWSDGCDCTAPAGRAVDEGDMVLIERRRG